MHVGSYSRRLLWGAVEGLVVFTGFLRLSGVSTAVLGFLSQKVEI